MRVDFYVGIELDSLQNRFSYDLVKIILNEEVGSYTYSLLLSQNDRTIHRIDIDDKKYQELLKKDPLEILDYGFKQIKPTYKVFQDSEGIDYIGVFIDTVTDTENDVYTVSEMTNDMISCLCDFHIDKDEIRFVIKANLSAPLY